ncbi:NAD(P)H-dependent amine dehydrogenase family protein [Govanella unica]|uniref:Dihydrodipicolinate reductase n=1 Tax=Govanella unica TaxID=2975056 RepID=A0A9X3TXJ3_9PROT|nr:hypothetical protein [Govania unica]MDA5193508.1 hypothetical protein [Govania unica]
MTYRVVQWATGAMGKSCLRAVIDHPDLELAGLYVYSDSKAGRDAGDIARRDPTGVFATKSIDDILALDADVVIHCPLLRFPYDAHDEDVCRLLESGKNVIALNNYFHPASISPAYAAKLEASAKKGGVTLVGAGINPGFIAERVAAMASGLCLDIDSIYCREVFDCLGMPNPDYVFGVMGMGSDPASIDLKDGKLARLFTDMYRQPVGALAERLGVTLDRIEADHQVTLAPEDIEARAGIIKAGTVAATNWQLHGIRNGERFITHSVNWVMGKNLPGYEDAKHWKVSIRGLPGVTIDMNLDEPENTTAKTKSEQYSAAAVVSQAIPHVVAAAPGLYQLPIANWREHLTAP